MWKPRSVYTLEQNWKGARRHKIDNFGISEMSGTTFLVLPTVRIQRKVGVLAEPKRSRFEAGPDWKLGGVKSHFLTFRDFLLCSGTDFVSHFSKFLGEHALFPVKNWGG
tara:strand:- start:30 stop:356 length:327 start_codon:yes stop_codon:yes gene_type:complete